jgi:general secretion pathway protein M
VSALHAQANRLERDASELVQLRAAPPETAAPTDLRALVQARIERAGLSRLLVRLDTPDSNQVRVEFGAIPFADWLSWVTALQTQQVRLESCRVDALSTPGLVSATATLVRARAQ